MSELRLSCDDLRAVLQAVAGDLEGHAEELRELDAALGDGDLGVTVQLAAGVLADPAQGGEGKDVGLVLGASGMAINKASPSTFGTLLASAFLASGAAVRGKDSVTGDDLVSMGYAAIEGIKKRGKADVGDKTMLDALVPAVKALGRGLEEDMAVEKALSRAAMAAEQGMRATGDMTAKYGRASWRREESKGVRDAGAAAMYYLIESFARHVKRYVV